MPQPPAPEKGPWGWAANAPRNCRIAPMPPHAGEAASIWTLRRGIHVVAVHNHMVGEKPAFYFTHFWGKGPDKELAEGLKTALEAQAEVGKKAMQH